MSDLADELDFAAQTLSCDGLVGALAPCSHGKDTAEHGFARTGQGMGLGSHVGIAAADDQNGLIAHILCVINVCFSTKAQSFAPSVTNVINIFISRNKYF